MTHTPPTHGAAAPALDDSDRPAVLTLLCRGLESALQELDLAELGLWLSSLQDVVHYSLPEDICQRPEATGNALQEAGADRLVLGLCSDEYSRIAVEAQARRAGLDPPGIQWVNLGICRVGDSRAGLASARAKVLLAGAVARARAFPGSEPENLKAVLADSGERVSRRSLFTLPPVTYVAVPTINLPLCLAEDGCDMCVGACPYGALERDGDAIVVSRSQCQSCGVCVESCPQRAVELPGWSPAEIEAQLSALLDVEAPLDARAIAFVCKDNRESPGPGWLPVRVPCAAMVSVAAVLGALARGATAVALGACGEECPTGQRENVAGRVDYCRQVLSLLGGPAEAERVKLLGPEDVPGGPAPGLPPVPGREPARVERVFGRGTAAGAATALADRYGAQRPVLEHPYSPLGLVQIDSQACTGCGTCAAACPTGALTYAREEKDVSLVFDARLCTGCNRCAEVCPETEAGAISTKRTTELGLIRQGPRVLFRGQEALCERCGASVAPRQMLERIAALLGDDYSEAFMERLCSDCRGI